MMLLLLLLPLNLTSIALGNEETVLHISVLTSLQSMPPPPKMYVCIGSWMGSRVCQPAVQMCRHHR